MAENEDIKTVATSLLREDEPLTPETDGFWGNVPNSRDGYVITARTPGV